MIELDSILHEIIVAKNVLVQYDIVEKEPVPDSFERMPPFPQDVSYSELQKCDKIAIIVNMIHIVLNFAIRAPSCSVLRGHATRLGC